jgi:hypothetical protein
MTNRKIIDYRVRIQVAEDSPDGVLLDFLKHERHPSFSHKEMVLWALRGYWMAIAFRQWQESGGGRISESQVQQMVLDAIHQLNQQIVYIQSTFEMEHIGNGADAAILPGHEDNTFVLQSVPTPYPPLEKWDEGKDLFDSGL